MILERVELKHLPYASLQYVKLDGLSGPFDSTWQVVTQRGGYDSVVSGDTRKMQLRCSSGLLAGATIWLPWDTVVTWLKQTEESKLKETT